MSAERAPGQTVSRFTLLEPIGSGGTSEVWKARDGDRIVAVKFTDLPAPELPDHPNIVRVLERGPGWIVMEYVEGESAGDRLGREGVLSLSASIGIMREVLKALTAAHRVGTVHGDLNPSNILLERGDRVRVTDFGGKVVTDDPRVSGPITQVRAAAYAAPEAKQGKEAGPPADIFSAGLILYELIMGDHPQGSFKYPSEVYPDASKKIDAVIRRAISPRPGDRFDSADQMREALESTQPRPGAGLMINAETTLTDLDGAVAYFLEHEEVGRVLLSEGRLEPWLRDLREGDLAARAKAIRESEDDRDIALQKFLEATGRATAPVLNLDRRVIDLGGLMRGEIRTVRIYVGAFGPGLLWGEVTVDSAERDVVKPRRLRFKSRAGQEGMLEFVVFTQLLKPHAELSVPLKLTSNGGSDSVTLNLKVLPRPAALSVLEPRIDAVFRRRVPGRVEASIRNDGDRDLKVTASSRDPWLTVEPVEPVKPGETAAVRIDVDAPAVPFDSVRHRRKGDRYAIGTVELETPAQRRRIEVRVWVVRSWDLRSFIFGLFAGLIPFINLLMCIVLAGDRFMSRSRGGNGARRGYRTYTEQRENSWFLMGLLPGLALHVLTLFKFF